MCGGGGGDSAPKPAPPPPKNAVGPGSKGKEVDKGALAATQAFAGLLPQLGVVQDQSKGLKQLLGE